jgi:hypothetical protein
VAELILAGPQHVLTNEIALTVTPEGFATTTEPQLTVTGTELVAPHGRIALDGRSVEQVATEAGVVPHALDGLYSDGSGLTPTHVLVIDPRAAAEIIAAFQLGAEALARFTSAETPILWPEHFDIGITVDQVNFGVSPGDAFLSVPYAYVGPWSRDGLTDDFWNAPFGSARPVAELEDLTGFFAEGAERAASRSTPG